MNKKILLTYGGGYFGYANIYSLDEDKRGLNRLFLYEHETRNVRETEYADVFEYLVKVGLREEPEVIKSV